MATKRKRTETQEPPRNTRSRGPDLGPTKPTKVTVTYAKRQRPVNQLVAEEPQTETHTAYPDSDRTSQEPVPQRRSTRGKEPAPDIPKSPPRKKAPTRAKKPKPVVEIVVAAPKRNTRKTKTTVVPVPPPEPPAEDLAEAVTEEEQQEQVEREENPLPPKEVDVSAPLPEHLVAHLEVQQRCILMACRNGITASGPSDDLDSTLQAASRQLLALLRGTVDRAEGNSCLLLGPRGSGKSQLLQSCLSELSVKPVTLRLSGLVQNTDRHALREMGVQLLQQTGTSILLKNAEETSTPDGQDDHDEALGVSLPPSSQLHTLIPALSTLNRPVVVVLDNFDLFALHPRQSLLYCLLDAVQNCRVGSDGQGLCVIGMASRIDTVQLLEKRVKSRFSGRTIRLAPPNTFEGWLDAFRAYLNVPIPKINKELDQEWEAHWTAGISAFLADDTTQTLLQETFAISRDLRLVTRLVVPIVTKLHPKSPYPFSGHLASAIEAQRTRPAFNSLEDLSYPALCILISCRQALKTGHAVFTFQMLYEHFSHQVKAATMAPVQLKSGASVGMLRCSKQMLLCAFEDLISRQMITPAAAHSASIGKEFAKYRYNVGEKDLKKAIEQSGQSNLKTWFSKSR